MKRKSAYIVLLIFLFIYGFLIGSYKIFPFPQILALKHYIEFTSGNFETRHQPLPPSQVEVYDSFLQKLLLKKIHLPGFNGHGGGLSVAGNILTVITNKGSVQTFDLSDYRKIENDFSSIPLDFEQLILSGHAYENNFRIPWFRVNGVYSEKVDHNEFLLFASHNGYDSGKECITHSISKSRFQVLDSRILQIGNWETIFTASPCLDPVPDVIEAAVAYPGHISGGIMVNYDEENLLVSVGDYNRHGISGTEEYAMNPSNPYGKFILLDKDSGDWSIFASGSRNATGIYIDSDSTIWSVENGPMGGDELNILIKKENYGWPKVSYGVWYDPKLSLPGNQQPGTHSMYKSPVFSWLPSVAPRGLAKIEGQKFNYWEGDLIMGTMRDQSLHRLRLDKNNRVVYDEKISLGHRIRDLTTLADGKILLLTDDGFLIVIEDGGSAFHDITADIKERMASLDRFDGFTNAIDVPRVTVATTSEVIFQQNCASCHNLNPTNQVGPHLHDLFNRRVGQVQSFQYSRSLKTDTRSWNAALLKTFLKSPQDALPGNKMQKVNLSSSEIDSLIHFFQQQSILADH